MACSKKVSAIFLIFFIVFSFSNVYAAETSVDPTEIIFDESTGKNFAIQHDAQYQTLFQMQNDLQLKLIARIYSNFDNPNFKSFAHKIFTESRGFGNGDKFMYIADSNSGIVSTPTNYDFVVYFSYNFSTTVEFGGIDGFYNMSFHNIPILNGTFYSVCSIAKDNSVSTNLATENKIVPYASTRVFSPEWFQLFKDYGFITVENSNNSDIAAIKNNTDKTQQELNNLNSSITNDNVNVDSSTLPSDTTDNPTIEGFNNIFQQLYNTFTAGTSKDLVINIPFTSKSFVINTQNVYGNANLGLVKTLIQTFWYFIISYFIVQDIGKKINKIKSGNIENVQENNIKEDML